MFTISLLEDRGQGFGISTQPNAATLGNFARVAIQSHE